MSIDRNRRISFEEVADLYNEVRLGYPQALVEDILVLSGISPTGRILEIGPGPGNATLPFARLGYCITAVELGARLADLARYNCRDYPNVEVICSSFEDWPLLERAFDLAFSADAFHWIPPSIGYPKVARALKESGSLALFWNIPVDPGADWSRAIDEVYQAVAPALDQPDKGYDADWLEGVIKDNFAQSGCFSPPVVRQYTWSATMNTAHYLKLLRTFSGHRGIDEGLRLRLYAGIDQVLARFGGQVTLPQVTILFFARLLEG